MTKRAHMSNKLSIIVIDRENYKDRRLLGKPKCGKNSMTALNYLSFSNLFSDNISLISIRFSLILPLNKKIQLILIHHTT